MTSLPLYEENNNSGSEKDRLKWVRKASQDAPSMEHMRNEAGMRQQRQEDLQGRGESRTKEKIKQIKAKFYS